MQVLSNHEESIRINRTSIFIATKTIPRNKQHVVT
jgi:hypothetical protein